MRVPNRPITATWIDAARPARTVRPTAIPVTFRTDASLSKRLNSLPSVSTQRANQPISGIDCLSSARPPQARTCSSDASMSSVSK